MKLRTKFQDKDFELGEVVKAKVNTYYDENKVVVMADKAGGGVSRFEYNSIKDFTDHWEDAPEEPKRYWFIDAFGNIVQNEITKHCGDEYTDMTHDHENQKLIGHYFETKEEAERAVEWLRAWKRLKDKGFKFTLTPGVGSLDITPGKFQIEITAEMPAKWFCCDGVQEDLDDCFGGEE